MTLRTWLALAVTIVLASGAPAALAARPSVGSQQAPDLQATIGQLANFDYATRVNAARLVRRVPPAEAVAALTAAAQASSDQFIRYRALVLLTGFLDTRTPDIIQAASIDRNDRLREVAYRWMAVRPQEGSGQRLLTALQTEQAEFVRPALVRALAALRSDPQVQRALVAEVARGQDFFRAGVIDALGEFKAAYAFDAIAAVAKVDGPLQDDAVLALGRIGDPRTAELLASLPSTAVSPEAATAVHAAHCLLGQECEAHIRAIAAVLAESGSRPEVARNAVTALSVLGASGSDLALTTLADLSRSSRVQDLATLGLGGSALRDPNRMLSWLVRVPTAQQAGVMELLRAAFERFEDDFAEEQFFAATRAAYWRAAEGSPTRDLNALLIQKLEF